MTPQFRAGLVAVGSVGNTRVSARATRRGPAGRSLSPRIAGTAAFSIEDPVDLQLITGEPAETERIMAGASAGQSASLPPDAPASVADVMRPALTTVEADGHIAAAAYLMRHSGETALVVVDDEQAMRPIGIITDADIAQAVADGKDVNQVRVRDLMTPDPTVVVAATSIHEAAEAMVTGHFRHLPVISDVGLIGIVDIGDLCRALLESAPG